MLLEVAGMIEIDPGSSPERVVVEFWMIGVKAVKLNTVTRVALRIGHHFQLEIFALMLLVTCCAKHTTRKRALDWKHRIANSRFDRQYFCNGCRFDPAYIGVKSRQFETMGVHGGFPHYVASQAGGAVFARVGSCDDRVQPAKLSLCW